MQRGFNDEFFKFDGDKIIFGEKQYVDAKSVKVIFVDTIGHDAVPEGDQFYVVRLKTIDNKLFKVCRGDMQHFSSDILKTMAKWLRSYGDFQQYGSSVINLPLAEKPTIEADGHITKVGIEFRDKDTVTAVNTPFQRVARRTYDKLKEDLVKYKSQHKIHLR